ncbi:MAG: ABC transporter ATP-binding protein [Candidatus Omnitrophica bacterium]|nr:ABC transporter ATP-binding protein [Candidatus Omnitrophota bacterium]
MFAFCANKKRRKKMRIDLLRVSKRFGPVVAVDGVTLAVEEGEFFFLLGPSGCGKTTLLRMLAGFEDPDEGEICFDGRNVSGTPPEKRSTGMVFQNYALWPHLSVFENVAFGLEAQGIAKGERARRVREALAMARMEDHGERRPAQLSGGQQQRVALARALVVRPALVLLDEPLSNLDARLRLEMRTEIREIIKRGDHTAVYVTHDRKEALAMADRCAILREGRIEQVGTPRELYERPGNCFVAEFLGDMNLFPATVLEIETDCFCQVRLDGADLVWKGRSGESLQAGQRVLCGVRPESARVGGAPDGAVNRFRGRVSSSIYLGEVTQHRVEIAAEGAGPTLRVLETHAPHREGETLEWTVAHEDVVLLGVPSKSSPSSHYPESSGWLGGHGG